MWNGLLWADGKRGIETGDQFEGYHSEPDKRWACVKVWQWIWRKVDGFRDIWEVVSQGFSDGLEVCACMCMDCEEKDSNKDDSNFLISASN